MSSARSAASPGNGSLQTGVAIATMSYDALGRRVVKKIENSADWDCEYHYYLDGQRIAEVRNGSNKVCSQYVWGLSYVDELVQTGMNQDQTYTTAPGDCERFFWIMQDANFNVLGAVAASNVGRAGLPAESGAVEAALRRRKRHTTSPRRPDPAVLRPVAAGRPYPQDSAGKPARPT